MALSLSGYAINANNENRAIKAVYLTTTQNPAHIITKGGVNIFIEDCNSHFAAFCIVEYPLI